MRGTRWSLLTLLLLAPLLVTLAGAMWRTPYPISETIGLLQDDGVLQGATDPWRLFDPTLRSWFRPLYHLTWWTLWNTTHSLDATLLGFRLLTVVAAVATVVLLIACLRPRSIVDAAAAAAAGTVLIGLPGFRDNLELPLLMTLVAMPLLLVIWMLLERPSTRWHGPVIVALLLISVGFKEQGLIIAPVVVMAWLAGSPGASRTTTAAVVVVTCAYLALRFSTAGSWQPFEQEVYFGFERLSADEANARFGEAPLPFYAYNIAATAAAILLSEPTSGQFRIVGDALRGELRPWQVNHLLSSLALTAVIGWWGLRALRQSRWWAGPGDARLFLVAGAALAGSAALGFNYSRDRLGGMAAIFYALTAYAALRAVATTLSPRRGPAAIAAGLGLLLLAAGWQIRAIGTIEDVRLRADRNHRDWLTGLAERRKSSSPEYLRILEAMTPQGLEPSATQPSSYPRGVSAIIGER